MPEYIALFLIWLLSPILIRAFFKKRWARGLPPSPPALPIVGHLHLLSPIPHQALAKLSNRYGPLIHIRLGSVPCIVASNAEMAREVLKTHDASFSDRPQTAAVDYITYGSQDFSFAPYGAYWKFMKKLCMSELLGGQTLDLFKPARHGEIMNLVRFLAGKARSGASVDMGEEFVRLTNNIISGMMMSQRCSAEENEAGAVGKLIHEVAEVVGRFNVSDYIWFCKNLDLQGFRKRLKDVRSKFDEMIERIIDEHENERREWKENGMEAHIVKDLLHILLDISEDGSTEIKLSRENIKAFILDIFVAGTDTSSITLEWALSELINHPKIMAKAAQELDSVVGRSRVVQETDIPNLPYIQAVVKETLRLHPAGPLINRESSEDCTIGSYNIPCKTRVFVNVWAIGRDGNEWENALEFKPERFLNGESGGGKRKVDVRGQHYQLLPFGSGRRGCPGTTLAMQVVQTTLASVIQCFEWRVEGENGVVSMDEGVGLSVPRAKPLVCFPVARLDPIPPSMSHN